MNSNCRFVWRHLARSPLSQCYVLNIKIVAISNQKVKIWGVRSGARKKEPLSILIFWVKLLFWSCAQVTAGSNVLGSFTAFCYKFFEQVTTGANVWRILVYFIVDFVRKWLGEQWWFRVREWHVCLIFSLILREWLLEVSFLLDHFISFNCFFLSVVLIRFFCCFPFCSKQMQDGWNFVSSNY